MGVISILGTRRSEECSFKQKILSLSAFLSVGICALDIVKKSIEKTRAFHWIIKFGQKLMTHDQQTGSQ